MHKAQKRDAARTEKFYFRKQILPETRCPSPSSAVSSTCCSVASSYTSSSVKGVNGFHKQKEKKLRNGFPAPPVPEDGFRHPPVEDEYGLMTMEEILVGKVCF